MHLRELQIDHVLDVGANRGQFAKVVQHLFPQARLDCFEPLPDCVVVLHEIVGAHGAKIHEFAASNRNGTAQFNVAEADDSSSLLSIGPEQVRINPGTALDEVIEVSIQTLDDWSSTMQLGNHVLVKLDIQGAELQCLEGAKRLLTEVSHVYVEVSFVELYEGQPLAAEIITWLGQQGFVLSGSFNSSYTDKGQSLQCDLLFSSTSLANGS